MESNEEIFSPTLNIPDFIYNNEEEGNGIYALEVVGENIYIGEKNEKVKQLYLSSELIFNEALDEYQGEIKVKNIFANIHTDTISVLCTSYDKKYLYAAGLDGIISVYDLNTNKFLHHFGPVETDIEHMTASTYGYVILIGCINGCLFVYHAIKGYYTTIICSSEEVTCCTLIRTDELDMNKNQIAVGCSIDGMIICYDILNNTTLFSYNINSNQHFIKNYETENAIGILCLANYIKTPFILLGTTSGDIVKVNITKKKFIYIKKVFENDSIEHIAINDNEVMVAFCSSNGKIVIWELDKTRSEFKHNSQTNESITSILYINMALITAGTDGMINIWDTRNGELLNQYDCNSLVFCMKYCEINGQNCLIVGCENGQLLCYMVDILKT